jgi:Tol biopolymer transport system component/LysM repeat protein
MNFQELLERYKQLRTDFDAGRIDEEEFQDEIEGLQVKDEQGLYWTIGAQTGKWYRFDGSDWVQETPLPMTKHQGRGIPEAIARLTAPRPGGAPSAVPRWLYTGCASFLLLVVVALLVVVVANFLQKKEIRVGQSPTPTLASGIREATPTPGPTPSPTSTVPPTATRPTLKVYSNSAFGFSVQYPDDWQAKETGQQVTLAPGADGLTTSLGENPIIKAVAFAVSVTQEGIVDTSPVVLDRAIAGLPVDPAASETGTRTVNGVEWAISQVKLNPSGDVGAMTAYVAATTYNNNAYTVLAAAPATEWNARAPIFQQMFDSLRFTASQVEAASLSPTPEELATEVVMVETSPTPEMVVEDTPTSAPVQDTPTPTVAVSPTPITYVVKEGDTLIAIAIQFDVSVENLEAANGIEDPTRLRIGQELVIPGKDFVLPATATATPTPTHRSTAVGRATTPAVEETPMGVTKQATAGETTVATPGTAIPEATSGTPTAEATATATPEATETPVPRPTPTPKQVALSGKIVYPVYDPSRTLQGQPGGYDIYMSDPQGNNRQLLVYNASQPNLNSGGDLLAYHSWDPTGRGLAFMTIGGGRSGMLTNYVEDVLPVWDPSSITLVFTSRREGDRVPRLYRVNQANNQESGFPLIAEYAGVFPNGRIAFKGCTPEGACGIFVVGPEGVGANRITDNTSDTAPVPSPDGTRIAFMSSTREGAGNYEIYIMGSGGENVTRLTNNSANDGLPAWSPDGSTIAFVSDRDGTWGIWAMNPDGSNQRKLFTVEGSPDGLVNSELGTSRGWLEERISWSK